MNNEFLYLFVSFDLVNSTEYKSKNTDNNWIKIFNNFYDKTRIFFKKQFNNMLPMLWKYVGDEILFYIKIIDIDDLYNSLDKVSNTIEYIITELEKSNTQNMPKLSVKSSVWLANCSTYSENNENNNINITFTDENGNENKDFLGNYIDIGFRISKYVTARNIVVSAELAYLLSIMSPPKNTDNIRSKLKIVSFEILKGVWDKRAYPIIWYSNDWISIKDKFPYDEFIHSEIIKNINEDKLKSIDYLPKIIRELDKEEEIYHLKDLLDKIKNDNIIEEVSYSYHSKVEIHCVAILINRNRKILIAKRSKEKKFLPNIWEFGCSQLENDKYFFDVIYNTYYKEFNIKITYLDEENPIGTYRFLSNGIKKQGIIFYAETECDENCCELIASKHSEYKWISEEEINTIEDDEIVENGKERIKKVFSIYSNRNKA
ncbi:hypothetical protein N4239_02695 [Brachyspira hyodysenteriae]|uniref:hypothetical protein n=1 Tax=Brachyspira hyodysenteriae TaxID=159 RepID=UPI002B25D970|nr:hypothetical protein [Brachyspira hyodysenteriae]WPC24717.1 hypothetical protein N4239_02695 [Brachyspira hyodysenteriae]